MTPEQVARRTIDSKLEASEWCLQNYADHDIKAATGVAVREYPLKAQQHTDYLLFLHGVAIGVIEAKKPGTPLSGAIQQTQRYRNSLPETLSTLHGCPFAYASTGIETQFLDRRDPNARARSILTFHTPNALYEATAKPKTLRERLKDDMPPLEKGNLRDCQFKAINQLEKSLAQSHPRTLIQMATGSGKTYAAVNAIYRLIQFAKIKRALFLVDRRNLGRQTLREFQTYTPPDDSRKFTQLYNVQHLNSNIIDTTSTVCITTIQRLYSILKNETLYQTNAEEPSLFEHQTKDTTDTPLVDYNPKIPIDTFDIILVDECHRSIYGKWRHVLEYFDTLIVGLTATPYKQTLAFFNHNLVYQYRHQQAVQDKVNVGYYLYRINTEITQRGSDIPAGNYVQKRDRQNRQLHWEKLDANIEYTQQQLDRDIVAVDQIRTVIQTFKDKLFTDLFPNRQIAPKTLVFAKDDSHAEDIVNTIQTVFNKGHEFCQKITYQSDKPEQLIAKFRTDPTFRIAVTVDMIATGTDIKPIECILFMRTVRSSGYFEQMKGRGVRTIDPNDLRAVTGDAHEKTHFFIVDAVGTSETVTTDSQPLPGKPNTTQPAHPTPKNRDQLIDGISEDNVISTGFDTNENKHATTVIQIFDNFIEKHRNDNPALQILCKHPNAPTALTTDALKTLEETLKQTSNLLSRDSLWTAYRHTASESVNGTPQHSTDIISLVRFAIGESLILEPFADTANRRFKKWISGKNFTSEQQMWLQMIRDHIATSLDIHIEDFEYAPFAALGNGAKVYQLFGSQLETLLKNLTQQIIS